MKRSLIVVIGIAYFLSIMSHLLLAAPQTPVFVKPAYNSTQNGYFQLQWSDQSASGATRYELERVVTSGAHYVTTYGNAQVTTQCKQGSGAISFDGNGDYLQLPDSPHYDVFKSPTDSWTIDFWVKHTTVTTPQIYMAHRNTSGSYLWQLFYVQNSGVRFYVMNNNVGYQTTSPLASSIFNANEWHHVALCKVKDEWAVYVDGKQVSYVKENRSCDVTGNLSIGQLGNNLLYMNGCMDSIRIEQANLFNAVPNASCTNTITPPSQAPQKTGMTRLLITGDGSIRDEVGVVNLPVSGVTYNEQALPNGTYAYRVRAYDATSQASPFSANHLIRINTAQPPAVPQWNQTTQTIAIGSATLQWSDESITNAASYQLQISSSSTFATILNTYTPTTNQQAITLSSAGTYYVRVKSCSPQNIQSGWSLTKTLTVVASMRPPVITTITPEEKRLMELCPTTYAITAEDPDGGALQYQLRIGDVVAVPYALSNVITVTPTSQHIGKKTIMISVKDPEGNETVKTIEGYVFRKPLC